MSDDLFVYRTRMIHLQEGFFGGAGRMIGRGLRRAGTMVGGAGAIKKIGPNTTFRQHVGNKMRNLGKSAMSNPETAGKIATGVAGAGAAGVAAGRMSKPERKPPRFSLFGG
jgi:hypothetical protein